MEYRRYENAGAINLARWRHAPVPAVMMLVLTAISSAWVLAQTSAPASTSTASPTERAVTDTELALASFERAGTLFPRVRCRVTYEHKWVDPVETTNTRTGEARIDLSGNSYRFLIRFTDLKIDGGRRSAIGEYYLFDGLWLTSRIDKDEQVFRREISRTGDRQSLASSTSGPFLLPYGYTAAELREVFVITGARVGSIEDAIVVALVLVPKPKTKLFERFASITLVLDTKSGIPSKVTLLSRDDETFDFVITVVEFPKQFPADAFSVETPPHFDVITKTLPTTQPTGMQR